MHNILQTKIQRKFGASAKTYDLNSGLHRDIAEKLFVRIAKEPGPSALLDVGCGTGYLTVKLKDYFPQSQITGLDFAPQMLEVGRLKHNGIAWVLADGHELPFPDGCFDIVVSNLVYQWAGDLSRALGEARRVLVPNGTMAFTLFAYNTCRELFQSVNEAGAKAQFSRLPDVSQVYEALVLSGFKNPEVDQEQIKIGFKDMQELIGWLRSIGANNLLRQGFLGPETMARAASIYREKFSCVQGVAATFEIVRVYAKS